MDLWEYSILADGTYGLNTETILNTEESANVMPGYKGTFTDDGRISGTIPQYISNDNGDTYQSVTDLKWLFYNCDGLKVMPKIPETVKSMRYTFRACVNLNNVCDIPNGVTDISRCFLGCTSMVTTPNLPDTIIDMSSTFNGCSNITSFYKFPNKVQDISSTFNYCQNLREVGAIPNSVTNMNRTFYKCSNLRGTLEINANLTGNTSVNESDCYYIFYEAVTSEESKLKLIGNCKKLEEIVKAANNPNITM